MVGLSHHASAHYPEESPLIFPLFLPSSWHAQLEHQCHAFCGQQSLCQRKGKDCTLNHDDRGARCQATYSTNLRLTSMISEQT